MTDPRERFWLSVEKYAASRRARGLSGGTAKAVRDAINGGRIPVARSVPAPVQIDPDVADAAWAARTVPTKGGTPSRPAVAAAPVSATATAAVELGGDRLRRDGPNGAGPAVPARPQVDRPRFAFDDDDADGDAFEEVEDFEDAKRRRESALADMAEFKRDETARRLVDAGEVKHAWIAFVRRFCNGLDALPDRLSEVLAATDDPIEVRAMLEREIKLLRVQLCDDPPDPRGAL